MDMMNYVIKAMNGDQNAIGELYYATYPKLRAVAISILKNEADAEDIVQDSYIKAFSSLHQLDNANKFESWLCKIVSNKCKDYLKKNKPILFSEYHTEDSSESVEWSIVDDSKEYNPEEVLISSDTRQQIMELLNSLPDEQRICLVYHVVQEMKISEIAELLEVSENTVKSRINYAKSKMQVKINELEKKGVKLRGVTGFALFPFLRHLFATEHISIPPISKEVIASSVKTITSHTIKHLGVKIVSSIIAVTMVTTAITGIVNPKVLYPIDVFNIVEEAPIKVLERFEDGFNEGNVDKMIDCLEPDIQKEIKKSKYVANDFLEEFLATNTDGVFGVVSSFSQCSIDADKNSSQIDSDSAKIITDIEVTLLSLKDTMRRTVYMKKIDGRWYIANQKF